MKSTRLIFSAAALTLVCVAGCGGAPSDPVENLKFNVKKGIEEFNKMPPKAMQVKDTLSKQGGTATFLAAGGDESKIDRQAGLKWRKQQYDHIQPDDVKYDVKKTDSLVSPFTAIVILRLKGKEGPAVENQADADASNATEDTAGGTVRCNYVFQDNKWVLKQTELRYILPGDSEDRWIALNDNVKCFIQSETNAALR